MKGPRRLQVGELVLIGDRVWRVLRVGPGSAVVEPIDVRHATFHAFDSAAVRAVEFDAPGRRMTISPYSEVQRVDPAEVEAMAKKAKTTKPAAEKKVRSPKSDGPMMTFAFRLPPDESKTIHAAAGKGGASRFARAVLLAAARNDMDAIKAAIADAKSTG